MVESTVNRAALEAALAEALAANHDADTIRLVLADCLAEEGDLEGEKRQREIVANHVKEAREAKYAATRRDLAVTVGKAFHMRIADLVVSKRGDVIYGRGGDEVVDWDAYGKRGYVNPHTGNRKPAVYRQGGTRVIGFGRSGRIVLENSRGNEVARLPMPPADAKFGGTGGALVHGDLFVRIRQIGSAQVAIRYGVSRPNVKAVYDGYTRTGIAVRFEVPVDCREQGRSRWGIFRTTDSHYWEHGATVAECRAEFARKLELAEADRKAAKASERVERATRLISRLCPNLIVTEQDARQVGYCSPGIAGFVGRFGLTGRESVTARELRGTGDVMVERPIVQAAKRIASERFATVA